jgi:hypothetical protein
LAELPRPEYPRPDRDRSQRWLNLNGVWDFTSPYVAGQITVPYAWETPTSGVGRIWLEQGTYARDVVMPELWAGSRVVLCFGAVHYRATVFLDDVTVGEHVGGHTPFEIDLTDRITPGIPARLRVEVTAPIDKRSIPHGKQRSIPRDDYDGVCFTPTSGIWQTVWLEARGRTYPEAVSAWGDSLDTITVKGRLVGDQPSGTTVMARVVGGGSGEQVEMVANEVSGERITIVADEHGNFAGQIAIEHPRCWSPDDPYLYRVEVVTGSGADADTVVVTTGLRQVEVTGEQIWLNGRRLLLRGVLDQGYWPGTGLTAPDDAALLRDLEVARDLGYTMVRKHIKLEDPRWLWHADRMGMLVWAEPPAPSRHSPEAARAFEDQLAPMVERDGGHPSIIIWGLYNEEWGLDWNITGSPERAQAAVQAYEHLRALDSSRPIVDNSGWSHVRTDIVDWHYYDEDPNAWASNLARLASGEQEDFPVKLGPDFVVDKSFYGNADHPRRGLPVMNSEYGAGFTALERAWHLRWETQELRRHPRFVGYVYTELTDVEHEMAGLVDAWRQPKDRGGLNPADVNADTVIIVDLGPACAGADIPVPSQPFEAVCHVAHAGEVAVRGELRAGWTGLGQPFGSILPEPVAAGLISAEPFGVSEAVKLDVPAPGGPARLLIWLVDRDDQVLARTFIDVAPVEEPNRSGQRA